MYNVLRKSTISLRIGFLMCSLRQMYDMQQLLLRQEPEYAESKKLHKFNTKNLPKWVLII